MIVAGFGFRKGAALASLLAAFELAQEGEGQVTMLATAQDKASALLSLGEALGLPVAGVSPDRLTAISTPTRSGPSMSARGTGSVAEASALAAAGPGSRLVMTRRISPDRMATCAIAQGLST